MSMKGKFVALVRRVPKYDHLIESKVLRCTDDAGLTFETYIPDAGEDVLKIVEILNADRQKGIGVDSEGASTEDEPQ